MSRAASSTSSAAARRSRLGIKFAHTQEMAHDGFYFQKWPVYLKGQLFVKQCYEITDTPEIKKFVSAVDQLRRSSLSIVLNIAEGAGKYGLKDKMKFYRTARGSIFESIAVIDFLNMQKAIPDKTHNNLIQLGQELGRMTSGILKKLGDLEKS